MSTDTRIQELLDQIYIALVSEIPSFSAEVIDRMVSDLRACKMLVEAQAPHALPDAEYDLAISCVETLKRGRVRVNAGDLDRAISAVASLRIRAYN